jgi:hypothetical protein
VLDARGLGGFLQPLVAQTDVPDRSIRHKALTVDS